MAGLKKAAVLVMVLAAALALGAWYLVDRSRHDDGAIHVSGNIEVDDVAVSFKIPGRVVRRFVNEGESIAYNKEIAKLETADLEADVGLREAEVRAANAALEELENGARPEEIAASLAALEKTQAMLAELEHGSRDQEKKAAAAQLAAADVEQQRLSMEWARAKQLFDRQTISKEQYDQATAARDVAIERYRQAREQWDLVRIGPRAEQIAQAKAARDQAEWQFWLVLEGPRRETIDQTKAKLQQAEASLRQATTRLDYATIWSPLTGIVLSKNIEEGEYVAPGTPVVTIANLDQVWLRAYLDESDVGRVKLGQEVDVTTDSHPGKVYKGRIRFISQESEFTPKSVQTPKERVRLVYRVRIQIDNPDKELKPGMPADARMGPAADGGRGERGKGE
jgi:HlyD family secretion protein